MHGRKERNDLWSIELFLTLLCKFGKTRKLVQFEAGGICSLGEQLLYSHCHPFPLYFVLELG